MIGKTDDDKYKIINDALKNEKNQQDKADVLIQIFSCIKAVHHKDAKPQKCILPNMFNNIFPQKKETAK